MTFADSEKERLELAMRTVETMKKKMTMAAMMATRMGQHNNRGI